MLDDDALHALLRGGYTAAELTRCDRDVAAARRTLERVQAEDVLETILDATWDASLTR